MLLRPQRLWKISLLLLSLAVLVVVVMYAWAMHFMVVNQVVFAGSARHLSAQDKAEIQHVVLSQDWLQKPANRLSRWRVTFAGRRYQSNSPLNYWLRGDIVSNQAKSQEGIIAVTKQDGHWKVAFQVGTQ